LEGKKRRAHFSITRVVKEVRKSSFRAEKNQEEEKGKKHAARYPSAKKGNLSPHKPTSPLQEKK